MTILHQLLWTISVWLVNRKSHGNPARSGWPVSSVAILERVHPKQEAFFQPKGDRTMWCCSHDWSISCWTILNLPTSWQIRSGCIPTCVLLAVQCLTITNQQPTRWMASNQRCFTAASLPRKFSAMGSLPTSKFERPGGVQVPSHGVQVWPTKRSTKRAMAWWILVGICRNAGWWGWYAADHGCMPAYARYFRS